MISLLLPSPSYRLWMVLQQSSKACVLSACNPSALCSQQGLQRAPSHPAAAAVAAAVLHRPSVCQTPIRAIAAASFQHQTAEQLSSRAAVGMLLPALPSAGGNSLPPLTLAETLQVVAFPPSGRNLGPRVEHVLVSAAGLLSEAVASALQLPQSFVLELIRFGAVHYCPVVPQPSPKAVPRMSAGHIQRMQQLRADGITRHGKNPKLQVPQRMAADCQVQEGGYIRVHVHPKRFPAAYSVDWRQRVLADRPEYVAVDKPTGVQVVPTVDNMLESVVALTAAALALPADALLTPHRLDVGTSGIVLLAKNPAFACWFSTLLKNKSDAVVKTYRCLSAAPPPCGPMVHWAVMKQRAAGEPAHTRMLLECAVRDAYSSSGSSGSGGGGGCCSDANVAPCPPVEGAVRCELIVEKVQEVTLTGSAAAEWGPAAYESTLQLVTGRTHQIRSQMAAVGCPLLGDQLYTALAALWQQEQQQQQQEEQQAPTAAQQLQPPQQQPQDSSSIQQPSTDHQQQQQHRHTGAHWSKIYQEDPSRPIGLQAARLRVRNVAGRMTGVQSAPPSTEQVQEGAAPAADSAAQQQEEWVEFVAGTPWWRA